jgi:hypothetical protein
MSVPRSSVPLAVLLAVVGLACAGCGGVRSGTAKRGEEHAAALEVENNTTLDVRIYLLRGGLPTRLGTVEGMSTTVFDLNGDALDRDIRFRADPVAGWRRTTTEPVAVRQGQRVSLKLDNMLRSYRLSVW